MSRRKYSRSRLGTDYRIQVLKKSTKMGMAQVHLDKVLVTAQLIQYFKPYDVVNGEIINNRGLTVRLIVSSVALCSATLRDLKSYILVHSEHQPEDRPAPNLPDSPQSFESDSSEEDLLVRDSIGINPNIPFDEEQQAHLLNGEVTIPVYNRFIEYMSTVLTEYSQLEEETSHYARAIFRLLVNILQIDLAVATEWGLY